MKSNVSKWKAVSADLYWFYARFWKPAIQAWLMTFSEKFTFFSSNFELYNYQIESWLFLPAEIWPKWCSYPVCSPRSSIPDKYLKNWKKFYIFGAIVFSSRCWQKSFYFIRMIRSFLKVCFIFQVCHVMQYNSLNIMLLEVHLPVKCKVLFAKVEHHHPHQ